MENEKKGVMSKLALNSAVEAVVAHANAKGIPVTSDELISLVKSHSAGATAAVVAAGIIPGAGTAIAIGIETGFAWSMYYRICTRLHVSIKKDVVKALASGFITNFAVNEAGKLIASTLFSFIPGLGTLGSVALLGLTAYSTIYYSGVIFMNLLCRVFKAGGSLDTMDIEQVKGMMKDISKSITFKSVKTEAREAYETRKEDGVAEAIEDDDTPVTFTQPKHTYWLHTGIDFGSTNSVMAWRLYKWSEDSGWQPDTLNNKVNNIVRCPTMLVFKSENPLNNLVQAEKEDVIIGQHAEELANDSQEPAAARTNFKSTFYDAPLDSEAHQEADRLIGLFMSHLYQLYVTEILNCLPEQVLGDMSATVHLSTPVRAEKVHRDRMSQLAQEAGFVHNGSDNFIDTSRNEAECIMHLTVDANISNMKKLMAMCNGKAALNLLFLDVGGSTTDIELIKQEIHSTNKSAQVLAMWPRENVQYMLGGHEVDRAIYEYLVEEGVLIERFANECWEHGTGKTLFRKLKENNNEALRSGREINSIGTILSACADPDEEEMPRAKYRDHRISREVYEQRICAKYINSLCSALHDVLKDHMGEEDVDAIFVTGAGSKLYFIHDLLLGLYGENPLNFTQIQADHSRLFDNHRDAATCCAEGAISGVM